MAGHGRTRRHAAADHRPHPRRAGAHHGHPGRDRAAEVDRHGQFDQPDARRLRRRSRATSRAGRRSWRRRHPTNSESRESPIEYPVHYVRPATCRLLRLRRSPGEDAASSTCWPPRHSLLRLHHAQPGLPADARLDPDPDAAARRHGRQRHHLPDATGEAGFAGGFTKAGHSTGYLGKAHFKTANTFALTFTFGGPKTLQPQARTAPTWASQHVELMVEGHNTKPPLAPPLRAALRGAGHHADGRGEEKLWLPMQQLPPVTRRGADLQSPHLAGRLAQLDLDR